MKLSHLEYLIFSGLAYCYFGKKDIGRTIGEILHYGEDREENKKRILIKHNMFKTFNYYATWEVVGEAILPYLNEWVVVEVLDKTDFGKEESKSGYYSVAFGKKDENGNLEDIVICYRGSQIFPFKEAYRDFIETDLKIGLGKKPLQFDEGFEFYKEMVTRYGHSNIHLTGHSLGGGIAQYVALMSEKILEDKEFVPTTVTFNSIGIRVEGMVKIDDFLELEEAKKFVCKMVEENKWEGIKSSLIFYLKAKAPFIKSPSKLLPVPKEFNSQNLKVRDIEKKALQSQLRLVKGLNLDEEDFNRLMDALFDRKALEIEIREAERLLRNFKENSKYREKVINFAHSNDFTATYFPHIGRLIYVDKYLEEEKANNKKEFLKTLGIFQKIIKEYHLFDVFIPFISRKNGMNIMIRENDFSDRLNIRYISSSLRRMIYKEKCSKKLLLAYYKREKLWDEKSRVVLKEIIINDFEKNKKLFIYGEHILQRLRLMSDEEFISMWFDALDKLSSPYEYQDIFDYINFVYEENIL
jgi:pimeloyl-ACP methyl ester carboxylesterase